METKILVELFSGSGIVSDVFAQYNYQTFKVDNRRRRGVCVPDIRADIGQITAADIIRFCGGKTPSAVWCSFPCPTFSFAAGNKHYINGRPVSVAAVDAVFLLQHVLKVLDTLGCIYFIENPVGRLAQNQTLRQFLKKTGGVIHKVHYSSYAADFIKPTHIITNHPTWQPMPETTGYGRGAKNPGGKGVKDVSTIQSQKIPPLLIHTIASAMDGYISRKKQAQANDSEINDLLTIRQDESITEVQKRRFLIGTGDGEFKW